MALRSGWLKIGRMGGAAVRLHWSVPLGALVFTGFRLAPGAWLGFALLVLVHELGHALAVLGGGLRLIAVDALGFGGLCRFEGYPTPRRRVLIAWAGVLAQAVVLAATGLAVLLLGRPARPFAADLVGALLQVNAWMILVNLLPIPPLDGAEAWGVVHLFTAARARRRLEAEAARAATEPVTTGSPVGAPVTTGSPLGAPSALHDLDELEPHELPPMPEEVRRVLDRIMAEGRAQHEAERKK